MVDACSLVSLPLYTWALGRSARSGKGAPPQTVCCRRARAVGSLKHWCGTPGRCHWFVEPRQPSMWAVDLQRLGICSPKLIHCRGSALRCGRAARVPLPVSVSPLCPHRVLLYPNVLPVRSLGHLGPRVCGSAMVAAAVSALWRVPTDVRDGRRARWPSISVCAREIWSRSNETGSSDCDLWMQVWERG
jgi:hypothetical protein